MIVALAIFCAVFTAYLSWRKPVWGVALVLFLLPTYLLRFSLLGIPFTVLEFMILTLFSVYLIQKIASRQSISKKDGGQCCCKSIYANNKYEILGIALFLAAGVLSLIVSPDPRAGAGVFKAYMIEPILFFIVFINTIKTKKELRMVFWALGLSAALLSLMVAIQYFTGWGIPDPWHDWPDRRATGPYGFPNAVGLYIAPILTAFIGLLLHAKFFTRQNVLWVLMMILLMVFALIAARVEGAVVAVTTGVFFMLLFTKWRWWAVGVGAVGLGILFAYEPTRQILLFQDVSGDVRLALWRGTKNLISAQPLFGAGLGAFPIVYDIYRLPSHVELLVYPHNIFLNFWVELGALGLAWLLGTLMTFFYLTKKIAKSADGYHLVLAGVMVCVLVYGLVDVPYFKNDLAIMFWTWLGVLTLFIRKRI